MRSNKPQSVTLKHIDWAFILIVMNQSMKSPKINEICDEIAKQTELPLQEDLLYGSFDRRPNSLH